MLRRTIIVVCVTLYLLGFAVMAHAQLPQISSGLSYLASSQNADGTWNTTTTQVETTAATITALESLKALNQTAGTSYTSGVSWLQAQSPTSVDYQAQRIHALGLTDTSINTIIPQLDQLKQAWGGDDDYETDNLDTASALQALKTANYTDQTIISGAIGYLLSTQNTDGGWGFAQGDDSNAFVTAVVSTTLQQFTRTTTIATSISKASAYLAIWQNKDGGFGITSGTAASTTFETALAYVALVSDGQTPALPLQNAVNYLTTTQSLNGSWNDDPYSTAMALKALYISENKPAPPPAVTTGSVTGVLVDDTTNAPMAGVSVVLAGNSAFNATSDKAGMFTLSGIPTASQQITFTSAGYAPLTITTTISAGTLLNLGTISLSANPTSGIVQGVVWDAELNVPYPGVTVQAQSGANVYEAVSGADGSYKITNVPAGTITGGTTSGLKPGYLNVKFSGNLAAGGILVYNPRLSKVQTPSADLSLKTDKALYKKGDNVAITVDIQNNRTTGYPATMKLNITDPSGASVYDTSVAVVLSAQALLTQTAGFTLPTTGQGGFYTAQAELYDANNAKLATISTSFGMVMSQISVTPKLPAQFTQGTNSVTFDLVNKGSIAISSGALAITLKDPDGQVITTASQPFSLTQGESKSLTYDLTFPSLKFGTYTISCIQSDETTNGQAQVITLPNSIAVSPLFDKSSYKIRETANLLITLSNTGKFNLDPAGAGLPVRGSVPDAGYEETRTLSPAPVAGNSAGSTLLYSFAIPETIASGQHDAKITVTLPSGLTTVQTAQMAILESSLALSPIQTAYTAGGTISPVITNSGGVDTQVQYKLSLYDAKSALIAEKADTGTVAEGSSLSLALAIPLGAVDGPYSLVTNFKDLKTGKVGIVPNPITITGVKGALQVQTDKQEYLTTEGINALSSITNSGMAMQNGNLHLQVVTATGNLLQKTWTSQYDFQQGVRDGVDTFGTQDSVTLLSLPDNFDEGLLNTDRWIKVTNNAGLPPIQEDGVISTKVPSGSTNGNFSAFRSSYIFPGDFDVSIDYSIKQWSSQSHLAIIAYINGKELRWGVYSNKYYEAMWAYSDWSSGPSAPVDGKLRLTRVGSICYCYYWNGNSWSLFRTFNLPLQPATIQFWANSDTQANPMEVHWDNFTSTVNYVQTGTMNLKYDLGSSDTWNKLSYSGDMPSGTSIKFRTRTATDETSLKTAEWSDYISASGSSITNPPGRWIEVETTLTTTNSMVTPVLRDLTVTHGHNPGDILWQTDVPVSEAQGATSNLSNSVGTLGVTGKLYLQGELKSATGQVLASAEYPFYVEQGNFLVLLAPDKKLYRPGETVTVSGEVKSLSSVAATGVALKVNGAGTGGGTLYSETFDLPANSGHPFSFTTTAGSNGIYGLSGILTQNAATLAEIADQYETASPVVTATLTAPDTAGNDPFTITLSLTNTGKVNATTNVLIAVDGGETIDNKLVTIPAGESRMLQYTRQITSATTYTATFSGDLSQTLTKSVAYLATIPDNSVSAKIVTDKISYNPNEQVTLTSTVTANSINENLSALIIVTNSQGQGVYSATSAIPIINQGQTITIKKYWNTGTSPAGTYGVTLQILNAAGVGIAKSTCNLVINSTTNPKALLKGQISLDKQNILTGETVTVSNSVTNTGNMDLSNITLSVKTINLAEETVYNTITDQAALVMGASYTKTGTIDTTAYSAKDYLVVLKASINGAEETLASTYFRVEGAPSAPALISPANEADVDTFTPALTVSSASDPNDDKLAYEFEIYSDNGLTNLVNSSGAVAETTGSTVWTVSAPLTENQTYFWRARAWDGKLYGPWMETATFRVNTVNDPPTAPVISSPVDNGIVSSLTPALTVLNATDPDSPSLTYNFDLALDSGFTQIVSSTTGSAQGTGTTSWQVPVTLTENTTYYWRSQADDWIIEGPWSTTGRFFVSTVNDPPSAPVIIAPVKGTIIKALETDITLQNSTDPDSPDITYAFELDTVPTFDSGTIIRSGVIQQSRNSTTWHVTGLTEDTQYYARAKASDGQVESAWSGIVDFFTNATNSAPTAPTLANPSNGAGVTVFTPTLSVHNSTDPDRDILTYDFQLYADAALTSLVTDIAGVAETSQTTSWTVPVTLSENKTYYWRARASDGTLQSPWMATSSFTINTANDAPGAPVLLSPANGSTITTLTPTLVITNAKDPDNDKLTYEYEVYQGNVLITGITNVPENGAGETSATLVANLADNTVYLWRARAFDGDRYGPWTAMASFTVHTCQHKLKVDIDFEPDTLNKKDCGKWVMVRIELPHGYRARDVDISSIRLEDTIPAELWPFEYRHRHHEHGCDHDRHGHHHEALIVKFKRSEVIKVLPEGKHVPVHVTGMVKSTPSEGVDIIRVISPHQHHGGCNK